MRKSYVTVLYVFVEMGSNAHIGFDLCYSSYSVFTVFYSLSILYFHHKLIDQLVGKGKVLRRYESCEWPVINADVPILECEGRWAVV